MFYRNKTRKGLARMKKLVVIMLCMSLMLGGCGKNIHKENGRTVGYEEEDTTDRPSGLVDDEKSDLRETAKNGKGFYDNLSDISSIFTKGKANASKILASMVIKEYVEDDAVPSICEDNYVTLYDKALVNTGNMLDYEITSEKHCVMLDTSTFLFMLGSRNEDRLDGWVYYHDLYLGEQGFKKYDNGEFSGDKYVIDEDLNLVGNGQGLNIEYTRSGYIITDTTKESEWVIDLKDCTLAFKSDDLTFNGSPYLYNLVTNGIEYNFLAFNYMECVSSEETVFFDGDCNNKCITANAYLLGRILQDVDDTTDLNTIKADILSELIVNANPLFGALDLISGGDMSEDLSRGIEEDLSGSKVYKGTDEEIKKQKARINNINKTIAKFLQARDEKSVWLYMHPDSNKVSKEEHDEYINQPRTPEENRERVSEIENIISERNQKELEDRLEEQRRKNEENAKDLQRRIDEKLEEQRQRNEENNKEFQDMLDDKLQE